MFLGRVDGLDDESIQTKFLIIGVPLAPISSFYATTEQLGGVRGFEIPLHGTSVAAGYLRLGLALAAILTGVFGYLQYRPWRPELTLFFISGACVALWAASMFLLGRLSTAEKERRRHLRLATGVGAPPEILTTEMKDALHIELERRALAAGVNPHDWKQRIDAGTPRQSELPYLLALAEYAGDQGSAARVRLRLGI